MKEILRASYVIARRDFAAIIFSKAFLFFLLGPLFPLAIGIAAGSLGSQVAQDINKPVIGIAMSASDSAALLAARTQLSSRIGEGSFPDFQDVTAPEGLSDTAIAKLLAADDADKPSYIAVLSGSLDAPLLTGPKSAVARWQGELALVTDQARQRNSFTPVKLETRTVTVSEGERKQAQLQTAQAGQVGLFLLTMLLAGMVLSNLVEEKTNKIIEILAAAIPIDAIFLGKLFAMLGMAFIGICVWMGLGGIAIQLLGPGLPALTPPAIGWPIFLALAFIYFAMAYLLLGSLFLGIGAMATTVREVQTLSMPVTMAQLLVFFLASYAVTKLGQPIEIFSVILPFSSPFAMLARAAQLPDIWPHLLALLWQALWAGIIIRISATLFKRNVMKSGKAKGKRRGLRAVFAR